MKKFLLFSIALFYAVAAFAQAPTITSFTPASGPVGTLVTVTGTNLGSPIAFTIGGVTAITISNTGTQLVGMVMPGAATGKLGLTTSGGTISSSSNFTVTVTPFPIGQQGSKLVGTGGVGTTVQGGRVAVSADGNTAVLGGVGDNSGAGAIWIFTRSAGIWTQQGSKLAGTDAVGNAGQGFSVAISADGNTVIAGGVYDNSNTGAAWIFTRSGVTWAQQGAKLVGTGAVGAAMQGIAVSISADGNTAIESSTADNSFNGATWVFTRNGSVWTQQGAKLLGTGAIGASGQGSSISLSADGNTAVIGGSNDYSGFGATWVFTRIGGVWAQQGTKLVATGTNGFPYQGNSVSVSADGNTAIVGGAYDGTYQGGAWIFVRTGGVWTQQGTKLLGTGAVGNAYQGAVSISADGNTAIVGGGHDNSSTGAVWRYTRIGAIWTQQGAKIVGTGATGNALQGQSVALSADGSTALVGGIGDDSNLGAVWVFSASVSAATPTITSITPSSGPVGTLVTITGTNLNTPTAFTIGGVAPITISNTGTQLVGMVMPGAITGKATITTAEGTVSSTNNFTVTATPYPVGQQGPKLVATDATGAAQQGASVSISADGNTAIVGAVGDNSSQGAAWIYTRSGKIWAQQGSKLVGTGAVGAAQQGSSVAISADGNTAVVAGAVDNSHAGAIWIFTRNNGIWTQQGAKLVGSGAVGAAWQGLSVSISADGNTVIEGGWLDNNFKGAAWIFTRSGATWTQQGTKLLGSGLITASSWFGFSVSLSADGNTAVVGAPGDNSNQGGICIFTRSGSTWAQQGGKLIGTSVIGYALQGNSVSISADGNTAIEGGIGDNVNQGASWVFTRTVGAWSQQGGKLVGIGATGAAEQGYSIAISADGNTAMIGGSYDNTQVGTAWIFTRNAGVWAQQGTKLTGSGLVGMARFSNSIALSADGATAVIGGPLDNTNIGAIWTFASTVTSPGPTITSISPDSGPVGTLVTISGANLNTPTAFTIGGIPAITISNTDSQLVGMVMPGAASGKAAITTANGSVNSTANFTIVATPYPGMQQGGKLVGTGASYGNNYGDLQGQSVAISADGSTAIVGAWQDGSNFGAFWIYTNNGRIWSQQGLKLQGRDNNANNILYQMKQGSAVAISADGNTAVIGAPGDNNTGAAFIFTRVGVTWTQQGLPLIGTGAVGSSFNGYAQQGYAVAMSADGNTVILGGPADASGLGASWIFTRSNGIWTQQGPKLVGSGNTTHSGEGVSVSLSADGNTAMIGGAGDNSGVGATWVFTRTGGTWTQQGAKLIGTGATGAARQGSAVAVSADGNTAIVGGINDNAQLGASWIFTRSGGVWAQQGAKLVGSGAGGSSQQGSSVSMSADGNTIVIGGPYDSGPFTGSPTGPPQWGAVWLFTRNGAAWTQQGQKLVGTGYTYIPHQGTSVAITADGKGAIVGGPTDYPLGAAWVYTSSTTIPPASKDATLKELSAGGSPLNPEFVTTTKTYTVDVANSISTIQLTPFANSTTATVKVFGIAVPTGSKSSTILLNVGSTTIPVVVTAQDGVTTQTYTVIVNRAAAAVSSIASLSGLSPSSGILSPAFSPTTYSYTASVTNATTSITMKAVLTDLSAAIKINGLSVISGFASGPITLNVGSNVITTMVTAQNGVTTQTYTLTVKRAASSVSTVASLSALALSSGTLNPVFAATTTSYAASVPNSTSSINVTPKVTDPFATIKVNGTTVTSGLASPAIALNVGNNTITVLVTAQDGATTQTYTVTATRAASASNVATLSGLTISSGTLNPVFSPAVNGYTATVSNATTSITMAPTTSNAAATVKINGTAVTSGSASGVIALTFGSNIITTVVTAQDGVTTQTYTLTVTRTASSVATLSGITLSIGSLSPAFSSTIYNYSASVGNSTSSITVTPTATDPGASINIKGVIIPSGSSTAPIALNIDTNIIAAVVMAKDGKSFLNYYVTVTRAAPPISTITSVNPATAASGTTVTITGSNFTGATTVSFGGVAATSFTVVSANTITALVGDGSSGNVSVATPVNTANIAGFNFVPVPTITAAGPTTVISGGSVILNASPVNGFSYQWLRNGININGATSASYTATVSGVYTVSISLNSVTQVSAGIAVSTVFELPANNFQFAITGATCKGSANGAINITAQQSFSYTATITGNGLNTPYAFTNSTQINNLAAGTYDVCITVAGQTDFQQCFTTVISEPKDLSVYTAVSPSGDQVVVNMNGASEYKIMLNGILYMTEERQITLPLAKGANTITVTTDLACQGAVVKTVNLSPEVLVYPNPFSNILNLSLGADNLKSALISVINVGDGKPVYTNIYNNVSGTMQIDLSGLNSGLYLLRVSGDNLEKVFKIIKK